MTAETKAFNLNSKRDGYAYWAEPHNGEWAIFRRGKGVDREAV